MTRERLLAALAGLKVGKHLGERAPHKPLLLLLALGRLWRDEGRLASYEHDVRERLRGLLRDFGPPRKTPHPEAPFWHLRGELWELPGADVLPRNSGGGVNGGELKRHGARAGLVEPVHRLLRRDAALLREVVALLLREHFPETLHEEIRERVGLPGNAVPAVREGDAAGSRRRRDPDFRDAVLRAYERRCSVCNFDLRIGDSLFGLEAAHIQWHSHDGPDQVPNGLALCTLHHKAFDRGVIGIEPAADDFRLLVSDDLTGQSRTFAELLDLRGQPLRRPQNEAQRPNPDYVHWHREQVFRGAPRP